MLARKRRSSSKGRATVLDLFAGCGGLSLGFHTAGFDILAGVEIDPVAARTHALNFHPHAPLHARSLCVTSDPSKLWSELDLGAAPQVDILVGGPPCQAFARVGRAKLRSEAARRGSQEDHRAWLADPRVQLYRNYLEHVRALRPKALLMENVPDVLNHGGNNLMEEVCATLEVIDSIGYEPRYTLMNAAHFGVPQMRERMFLIAFRKDLRAGVPEFPPPTHSHELPIGYQGTRNCAVRPLKEHESLHFVSPAAPDGRRRRAITAEQALGDLSRMDAIALSSRGELRRGPRRLDEATAYSHLRPQNAYQRVMRQWPGFEAAAATAHVIRHLPRDYPIFARMRAGDQYPEALAIANEMLREALRTRGDLSANELRKLEQAIVPPYDATKFPNKWRKMEPDAPARTLMAHLGKDSYSHIHYDSKQARTISVREAARLQSFPDGFRITGSMNHGFRQIGNAVPPLLAYALARQIGEQLGLPLATDFRYDLGFLDRRPASASA